jgi:hypothetical protein
MTRREFITLLGGAAAAWPLAARAQQPPSILRVGLAGVQPRTTAIYVAFLQRMAELGYEEGKNFVFDYVQVPNIDGYERGYQNSPGTRSIFGSPAGQRSVSSPPWRLQASTRL